MDWLYKINIKQFLSDNDSDEEVKRIAPLVAKELRKAAPFREDYPHSDLGATRVSDLEHSEDAEGFNEALENIYNYADDHAVWLGIKTD